MQKSSKLRSLFDRLILLNILLLAHIAPSIELYSQSVITKSTVHDHIRNTTYSRHKIVEFRPLRPDDYNSAIEERLGVVANDFYGKQSLSKLSAQMTKWSMITGFKETLCGPMVAYYKRTPYRLASEDAEDRDDDIHFELIPTLAGKGLHQDAMNKIKPSGSIVGPEIDISDDVYINKMRKYNSNVPKQEIDYVGVYGPWVLDEGHNNLEIHAAEQVWWVNRKGNIDNYHLYSFYDASGRKPFGHWTVNTVDQLPLELSTGKSLSTTFSVAIQGKLHTPPVKVELHVIHSKKVVANYLDAKRHFLIYNRDTLAIVNENYASDIIEIKFEKIGLDPGALLKNPPDSIFTGFVVIRSEVGNDGALLLNCDVQDQKNNKYRSLIKDRYRVTLEKFICDAVDDFDSDEDLFGYIGVQAISNNLMPVGNTVLSRNALSLLWFRRDGVDLKIKKDQTININSVLDFDLDANSVLTIKGDLEEDDTNEDYNESIADDDRWYQTAVHADDKLADNGNVKSNLIQVSNLSRNVPEKFTQTFSSGGSKIRVVIKVEKLTDNSASPVKKNTN